MSSNEKIDDVVDNQKNGHDNMISPFEWLTNFASVSHLMPHPHPRHDGEQEDLWKALHVGCGTSTLGEQLISELGYDRVVNVDCNEESLDFLHRRPLSQEHTGTQTFVTMDFCQRAGENPNYDAGVIGTGSFDLVVDKSTLDCALCSEHAATGLLFHSYRALRPNGGVYFLISFNHVDFIKPLLEGLPGAHWTTEHHVIRRQLDHHEVNAPKTTDHNSIEKVTTTATSTGSTTSIQKEASTSAWSSGSFEPDAEYGRTVNVFVCRRHDDDGTEGSDCELDWDAVRDHVFRTNDSWFKEHNPILTHVRRQDLRRLFTAALLETEGIVENTSDPLSFDNAVLSLEKCYTILFTEAEKEQLSFDYFLEDWNEFYKTSGGDKSPHGMTFDTAVQFLNEMQ